MSGWRKTGSASVIILLLTSAKTCSQPKKIAQWIKLITKFAHNEQIYCEQKFAQYICSRRIEFVHRESWIALHSTCNLSMDSWHDFYQHTNCSKQRKFAHSKEKLLTKIKFAEQEFAQKICSKQKFAHRICSQDRKSAYDERPCRLGWIITMAKCLALTQSEHGWRASLNGPSRNSWNVLGRTFKVVLRHDFEWSIIDVFVHYDRSFVPVKIRCIPYLRRMYCRYFLKSSRGSSASLTRRCHNILATHGIKSWQQFIVLFRCQRGERHVPNLLTLQNQRKRGLQKGLAYAMLSVWYVMQCSLWIWCEFASCLPGKLISFYWRSVLQSFSHQVLDNKEHHSRWTGQRTKMNKFWQLVAQKGAFSAGALWRNVCDT